MPIASDCNLQSHKTPTNNSEFLSKLQSWVEGAGTHTHTQGTGRQAYLLTHKKFRFLFLLSTSALNCSQGSKIKRLFSLLFKNGDDSHKKLAWEVKSMTECDDRDFSNLGANFAARTPTTQIPQLFWSNTWKSLRFMGTLIVTTGSVSAGQQWPLSWRDNFIQIHLKCSTQYS